MKLKKLIDTIIKVSKGRISSKLELATSKVIRYSVVLLIVKTVMLTYMLRKIHHSGEQALNYLCRTKHCNLSVANWSKRKELVWKLMLQIKKMLNDTLKALDDFKNKQQKPMIWKYLYSENVFNTLYMKIKHGC